MYKKLLVPLDGSETGECSLAHLKEIAKGCNVPEVVLLFVVEPVSPGLYQSSEEGKENLRAYGKDYLSKTEKDLSADGIAATSIILEGKPAEIIVDYTTENSVDLIIISTHGRSGVSRWAFGGVADKVIRSSTAPVLIAVPKGCRVAG